MNAFDLLNENEKVLLLLFLKGKPTFQVANLFRRTPDVINDVRLQMIAKLETASSVKNP